MKIERRGGSLPSLPPTCWRNITLSASKNLRFLLVDVVFLGHLQRTLCSTPMLSAREVALLPSHVVHSLAPPPVSLTQIRGEPKSGTTFMYEWAANALMVACGRIERMYGMGTCKVDFEWAYSDRRGKIAPITSSTTTKNMKRLILDFDPRRWRGPVSSNGNGVDAACPCENLDR